VKICIDTVIFIDILKDEYPKTQEKFYDALEDGHILVSSVITVAELMPQFKGNRKELVTFLKDHHIKVMDIDIESALTASERWIRYLNKKKSKRCPSCKAPIPGRDKILADFLIGGFAITHCDRILTRDRGIYRTYFSDLEKL
jgi:predicted nucleic acid-binding protein